MPEYSPSWPGIGQIFKEILVDVNIGTLFFCLRQAGI